MSFFSQISLKDGAQLDAFGGLRVSQKTTIFDSKQIVDKQPLFWDDQLVSGAGGASTYNTNQASTTLSVAASTAAVRVRQTFRHFLYQPGKSQLVLLTGIFGTAATGITKRIGLFNSNNGLYFEQISTGIGIVVRTFTSGAAVNTRVEQADWNVDKLDGTGLSEVTLDLTKTQIFFMDFEWLGVGRIRYGFCVDGQFYVCHEVNNANINTLVYMSTPNLPLRYEIENNGTGAANSLTHICCSVVTEGGLNDTGITMGATRGATAMVTNNNANIYPLAAMRLKSTHLQAFVKLLGFTIQCTSTAAYNYYIMLNPTVTGTAFSYTPMTNSSVEVDVARLNTTTVSAGTNLVIGTAQQNGESLTITLPTSDFALGSTIAGVSDVIVIGVQRITGTAETFYGSINWKEII